MLPRPMDTKLKTRMSPSLALLTIANLTPKEHEVIIENENVEKIDFDEPVDMVAITVTVDVINRAVEISKEFQNRKVTVIAGGIHITAGDVLLNVISAIIAAKMYLKLILIDL